MIEKKRHGRPSKRPDNEILSLLYSSMTAGEIAKKYNVSERTIRGWIYKVRKEQRNG